MLTPGTGSWAKRSKGAHISKHTFPHREVCTFHRAGDRIALAVQYEELYISLVTPTRVKALRTTLGLSQQQFASILGFSFVSINKWENGGSQPTDMSAALLALLESALKIHSPAHVLSELRPAGGTPLEVIRILARLEVTNVTLQRSRRV
ncbi:helix-turn-helix domain-containing protein [Chondromyces crocatus]|uniref:helix-turn-helix domain-containing protein n=1 Tax=Chondromyces crocatus TaxID=52 RepID=UPI0009EBADDB|nr:helix-turn-helix transcriptional regulator [Chondromyces crocatus]